ncbi:MAG TPA: hypothetical protein VM686_00620 [Polyangiaceae bacterium]|nr:hypothetical protein [Polyangiaceae bacterium]
MFGRSLRPSSLLLVLVTWGCGTPAAHEHTGSSRHAFGASRHETMTRIAAEAWADADTVALLETASLIGDTDPATWIRSEAHFDNCYWNEGRDWVLENRADAVEAAVRFASSQSAHDRQDFFNQFGYALHAVEDHYAHSNWVETHAEAALAPLDVAHQPKPDNWFSGTYENAGDTGPDAGALHCPPDTPHHDDFAKDDAGTPEAAEAFFTATIAVTDQLRKLVDEVRAALPGEADDVLGELGLVGFLATTSSRSDATTTTEAGASLSGYWTPMVYCRPSTWAAAFEQRVEPAQGGGDDTGLNSVALLCADQDGTAVERLTVWEGAWGNWSERASCPAGTLITGGDFKIEASQGDGDDNGATAARFHCAQGGEITAPNDAPEGNWEALTPCAEGDAVCGLALLVQPPLESDDDTAVSGIRLSCCSVADEPVGTGGAGGGGGGGGGYAAGAPGSGGGGVSGSSAVTAGGTSSASAGTSSAGSAGAGPAVSEPSDAGDDGGCGCRMAPHGTHHAGPSLLAALLAWMTLRRPRPAFGGDIKAHTHAPFSTTPRSAHCAAPEPALVLAQSVSFTTIG